MRPSTAGTTPSGCSTSTRSRCATSSWALPSDSASCCALTIASVAFWVNRSVRMGLAQLPARVGLRDGGEDRLELLAGFLVELGQHHAGSHDQVSLLRRTSLGQASSLDADLLAVLGIWPDAELHAAGRGWHGYFRTQQGLCQGQRKLGVEICAATLEARIRLDANADDKVATVDGAAQLDLRAIRDARRDLHVQPLAVDVDHPL